MARKKDGSQSIVRAVGGIVLPVGAGPVEQPELQESGVPVGIDLPPEEAFQLERCRLLQPVSNTDGLLGTPMPGMLYTALGGRPLWPLPEHNVSGLEGEAEALDALAQDTTFGRKLPLFVLPVWIFPERILFGPDNRLACRSLPGAQKAAPGFTPPAGTDVCAECPKSQWTDQPPECTYVLNVVGHVVRPDKTLSEPIAFGFARTSLKPGRRIVAAITGQALNPWQAIVGIWTVPGESDKGKYFRYEATLLGYAPKELAEQGRESARRLMALRERVRPVVVMDDLFPGEEEGGDVAPPGEEDFSSGPSWQH